MKTNPFPDNVLETVDDDTKSPSVSIFARPINHSGIGGPSNSPNPRASPTCPRTHNGLEDRKDEMLLRSPGEYGPHPDVLEREIARMRLDEIDDKKLKALNALTDRTGMPLTQENGQRRYGPPLDCPITVPPRGSEVFVGKLPRDCYEPELVPVFEKAGQIYELRLMMDFSGTNRGYCFVHYFQPEEAERAVRELNNYEIREGRRIGVVKSVDNCRLYIAGIPMNKTEEEIYEQMDKLTDGVIQIIVHPTLSSEARNRGFAFVEYESHKAAAMARRKLMPGKLRLWGGDVAVDWAEPAGAYATNRSNKIVQTSDAIPIPKESRERALRQHDSSKSSSQVQDIPPKPEPFHKGPRIPAPRNKNLMVSFQQRAVFQQGVFTSYGPNPEIHQQYSAVNNLATSQNFDMYGISPPIQQNQMGCPSWLGVPGVPPCIYLGQWGKGWAQKPLSCSPEDAWRLGMGKPWMGMNRNSGLPWCMT